MSRKEGIMRDFYFAGGQATALGGHIYHVLNVKATLMSFHDTYPTVWKILGDVCLSPEGESVSKEG